MWEAWWNGLDTEGCKCPPLRKVPSDDIQLKSERTIYWRAKRVVAALMAEATAAGFPVDTDYMKLSKDEQNDLFTKSLEGLHRKLYSPLTTSNRIFSLDYSTIANRMSHINSKNGTGKRRKKRQRTDTTIEENDSDNDMDQVDDDN